MRAPEFWTRDDAPSRFAVAALSPIGWIYGATVAWRATHEESYHPNAKVICVGNLTAGGTGKTPVAIAVARAAMNRGLKTFFLSRGYGGRAQGPLLVDFKVHDAGDVGDEPLLLARAGPTIVSRDRRKGAELVDSLAADIIVMDDGHQNFTLKKDLSIVVIDAADPFGNGRMLPAGPLREPVRQGLSRADAVVLVGPGDVRLERFAKPVLRASLVPEDINKLRGRRVVAFAGIGQPRKFFDSLKHAGADVADTLSFGDHHAYTASQIARIRAKAKSQDAMLITTEKDYLRLTGNEREGIEVLRVSAQFDSPDPLDRLLDSIQPEAAATKI